MSRCQNNVYENNTNAINNPVLEPTYILMRGENLNASQNFPCGSNQSNLVTTNKQNKSESVYENTAFGDKTSNNADTSPQQKKLVIIFVVISLLALLMSLAALLMFAMMYQVNTKILSENKHQQDRIATLEKQFIGNQSSNNSQQQIIIVQNQSVASKIDLNNDGWYAPLYQYMLTTSAQNWNESRNICKSLGGDLAVVGVQDPNMRKILANKLNLERAWIGLSDLQVEGDWQWTDGTKATNDTVHWNAGEPNDDKLNEDCAEMLGLNKLYKTNDLPCNLHHSALCEKLLIS